MASGTVYAATGIDGISSGAETVSTDKYYGTVYTNDETGYRVVIEDDAGLLTDDEKSRLAETMKDITPYGDVAFKSIDYNSYSTETYIVRRDSVCVPFCD